MNSAPIADLLVSNRLFPECLIALLMRPLIVCLWLPICVRRWIVPEVKPRRAIDPPPGQVNPLQLPL